MVEVLPGIYQLQLTMSGFPPGCINVYLIRGDNGLMLIDTGWDTPELFESLTQQLGEIGAAVEDIKQVVITHCHTDHLGLIGRLRKSRYVRVYMHENERALFHSRFSQGDTFLSLTDRLLQEHGVPAFELPEPYPQIPKVGILDLPEILLLGGEAISWDNCHLDVLCTPGHTPGHISLYEPEKKVLFSGDVLLPTINTNVAMHLQFSEDPLREYLDSLKILQKIDINLVLPGHENPFTGHSNRIDEIFRYHEQRNSEILAAMGENEPKTAYQVSTSLTVARGRRRVEWSKLTAWDKRYVVLDNIAHLEYLRFDNGVSRFSRDGTLYYQIS
jgi:glyoxylase-like metal-dependent hydrolase (beta-lactamase superfamily II)